MAASNRSSKRGPELFISDFLGHAPADMTKFGTPNLQGTDS